MPDPKKKKKKKRNSLHLLLLTSCSESRFPCGFLKSCDVTLTLPQTITIMSGVNFPQTQLLESLPDLHFTFPLKFIFFYKLIFHFVLSVAEYKDCSVKVSDGLPPRKWPRIRYWIKVNYTISPVRYNTPQEEQGTIYCQESRYSQSHTNSPCVVSSLVTVFHGQPDTIALNRIVSQLIHQSRSVDTRLGFVLYQRLEHSFRAAYCLRVRIKFKSLFYALKVLINIKNSLLSDHNFSML